MDKKGTVLITGASAGIGYELARIFAREGYDLILNARKAKRLSDAAASIEKESEVKVWIFPLDLSLPDSAKILYEQIKNQEINVDILINNAGIGTYGYFKNTNPEQELEMMRLNMISLTELTKLFLPRFLEKKKGSILNVASTAGFQPGPLMAVYYGTKAYVISFSRALRNELRKTGINVSVLCPGPTESDFWQRAGMNHGIFLIRTTMSSIDVAKAGYRGLMRNKEMIIPGTLNKILALASKIFPAFFAIRIVRLLQESRGKKKV